MKWLEYLSQKATDFVSSHWGTLAALGVVGVWLVSIPLLGASRAWGLVDKVMVAVSFLLLFLLQRSQTKATLSIQVKLNELLASVHRASPQLINIEDRSEEEVRELHDRFQEIQQRGPGRTPSTIPRPRPRGMNCRGERIRRDGPARAGDRRHKARPLRISPFEWSDGLNAWSGPPGARRAEDTPAGAAPGRCKGGGRGAQSGGGIHVGETPGGVDGSTVAGARPVPGRVADRGGRRGG